MQLRNKYFYNQHPCKNINCKECRLKEIKIPEMSINFIETNCMPWQLKFLNFTDEELIKSYRALCKSSNSDTANFMHQTENAIGLEYMLHQILEIYTLPFKYDGHMTEIYEH